MALTESEIVEFLSLKQSHPEHLIQRRALVNDILNENYYWMLRMCTYELQSQEDALDCVQEIMVEIIKSIQSFKGDSSLKTWMYSISKRCVYRYRNKRKKLISRFLPWDSQVQAPASSEAFQDKKLELKQENAELLKAVQKLPPKQREAVLLFYLEELSVSEVAKMMACSVGTVKAHLHRARNKLAILLAPLHLEEV